MNKLPPKRRTRLNRRFFITVTYCSKQTKLQCVMSVFESVSTIQVKLQHSVNLLYLTFTLRLHTVKPSYIVALKNGRNSNYMYTIDRTLTRCFCFVPNDISSCRKFAKHGVLWICSFFLVLCYK